MANDEFYLNGQEFRVLSGSLHYFRVHPDYWLDRLTRMRAMGLNAVQSCLILILTSRSIIECKP